MPAGHHPNLRRHSPGDSHLDGGTPAAHIPHTVLQIGLLPSQSDGQRDARTMERARVQVAAQLVGAEQEQHITIELRVAPEMMVGSNPPMVVPEIQSRGPVLNRGRDVYVVDHDYTQFVDSFEARIGGHQMIGADPQGRGEYHGVDGEQTVSGLQLQATSIVRHAVADQDLARRLVGEHLRQRRVEVQAGAVAARQVAAALRFVQLQ